MNGDRHIEDVVRRIAGSGPGLWIPAHLSREGQVSKRLGARWIVVASHSFITGTPATPAQVNEGLQKLPFPDGLCLLASPGLITAFDDSNLLRAQRDHGIDTRCACRWHIRGQERRREKDKRNGAPRDRVRRLDAEQQTCEKATQPRGGD